jgi:GntR family carbon starvation induced transcriptional regulator
MGTEQIDQGRASLTEDAYDHVRAAILGGRYLPDQKLKINELCGEVQGGLGAVREALSRLLAEGLVVSEPYKGFQVAPVSPADLIHLTQARIEVEKLCLASSLANGDVAWEGRLLALLHQLSRYSPLSDVDEWSRLHSAFHDALVSACDNSWLLRMHRILHEQSERYRRLALRFNAEIAANDRERDTPTEHREIVEAAIARDIERAGNLMAAHLQTTTDFLLTRLGSGSERAAMEPRRRGRTALG